VRNKHKRKTLALFEERYGRKHFSLPLNFLLLFSLHTAKSFHGGSAVSVSPNAGQLLFLLRE
jgi:hypothetical protein